MEAFTIVEHLDVLEQVAPQILDRFIRLAVRQFLFAAGLGQHAVGTTGESSYIVFLRSLRDMIILENSDQGRDRKRIETDTG